jgi:1-acyl-sn-glycerol-3-phosphate acyltransferase
MNTLRALAFALWLYGSIAVVGILGSPIAAFSRQGALDVARVWAHTALFGARWIMGITIVVEGREHIPQNKAIIAIKHQAMVDTILPFLLFRQPIMVLKQELVSAPVYGWFAMRMQMIPVARDTHASALKAMLRGARPHIEAGRQIVIFPEGTRTTPGAPADYKPGVAALYKDLAVSVTPVALNSGVVWPAKGHGYRPGVITVRVLPSIPPGLSRADFMAQLEQRIESASNALLDRAIPLPPTALARELGG